MLSAAERRRKELEALEAQVGQGNLCTGHVDQDTWRGLRKELEMVEALFMHGHRKLLLKKITNGSAF